MTLTKLTVQDVRALLDDVRSKDHADGVVAVQAQPVWDDVPTLDHRGTPVTVVVARSALGIRDALLHRRPQTWLVIVTDQPDSELGLSIRAHLAGQRVHRPDAWAGVRQHFAANRVDHRLVVHPDHRALAAGVLGLPPPQEDWPPAPGGFLTVDHLCSAVADARLGLRGRPDIGPDLVLEWSTAASVAADLAELRTIAGNTLTDFVVEWIARQSGPCEKAAAILLHNGRANDVVPLGLVARSIIESDPGSGPRALFKQEVGVPLSDDQVRRWADLSQDVVEALLATDRSRVSAILDRADVLLERFDALDYARASPVLRSGLADRLTGLGNVLLAAIPASSSGIGVRNEALEAAERELTGVRHHVLAKGNVQVDRAEAGVRLLRWLATGPVDATGLGELSVAYSRDLAWVDRAVNDAWSGVQSQSLSLGLQRLLHRVRGRRASFDEQFGRALAEDSADPVSRPAVMGVESLLHDIVMPIAADRPVLLVVADGMSMPVATEMIDDLDSGIEGWRECVPAESRSRMVAHAVLPTLTEVSRASLLCGTLTRGQRSEEQIGFERMCKEHGYSSRLFHKYDLERSQAGFALAREVADTVGNVHGVRIVGCVLNTVDDALDRSNPGGTTWTSDAVKHLEPLLTQARRAGRVVVLTADHGHIVERREGHVLPAADPTSNRSRTATSSTDVQAGELYIEGRRVLTSDGTAVLAVDEMIRYGPMKAGYHGGAAPAEVVVPVVVLCSGGTPGGWIAAPPQTPLWWNEQVTGPRPSAQTGQRDHAPTLFDAVPVSDESALGARLVGSRAFRDRKKVPGAPKDEHVSSLISALAQAPGHRLSVTVVATVLGVPETQVGLAVAAVQRLVNVDQYPVLARGADQRGVELDVDLLHEQFGLGT